MSLMTILPREINAKRVSTKRPGLLWRFLNRNRAWCLPVDRIAFDRRTDEQRRRGDELLEKQSRFRVFQKLRRKGVVDSNGFVRAEKYSNNVVPFARRAS